jgi:hypothetical protein
MAISFLEEPLMRELAIPIHRSTYQHQYEMGFIPENSELVAGVIIKKMTKSPRHSEFFFH